MPGKVFLHLALVAMAVAAASPAAAQLVISEFRLRGANGAADEFIEIANASGADHTVASPLGTGYGIAASDGVTRCSIPDGTVIARNGHFLCVNSVGYSLAGYPAGNGATAAGDATYTADIADNAGIAIFTNNLGGISYTLARRMDAAGSTAETSALYREGAGYPTLAPYSVDHSLRRDDCGKQGSTVGGGWEPCPSDGALVDTDDNAHDFVVVDTNGTSFPGNGQRLGTPGPENLSSPTPAPDLRNERLDPCFSATAAPNRLRDPTPGPPSTSSLGTIEFRRTFTNRSGASVTRLRLRIIDLTTFPAASGIADLRALSSSSAVVTVDRPPCGFDTSNITVHGTTLEQPPTQPNGGAFGSTLSAGTVTLATPLANNDTIDLRFVFGIQQTGTFRIGMAIEALPAASDAPIFRHGFEAGYVEFIGVTDG